MIDRRLLVCAVASIAGHLVVGRVLDELPQRELVAAPRPIEIRIVEPPPPPPPPAVEPPKPEPMSAVKPAEPRPVRRPASPRPVKTEAPVVSAIETAAPIAKPVFGVTMESTSRGGSTDVPVGNTTVPQPGRPASASAAGGGPRGVAAAHEVTKLPMPRGRCAGKYTDAARAAAIEGVVVLDLVVDASGSAREIQVVEGLGHGLTEAAVAALRACKFMPGEREGTPVTVKIRGFKIRFVLQDGS